VLGQHNFSNQKQIELLQIIDMALLQKDYPKNIHSIIERKIQLLQQPQEIPEKDNPEQSGAKRTQKVTTDVLMLLLEKSGISAVSDDKAKMARLIAYLTDFSEEKIRQRLSNPEELTSYHREEVENINKILAELNSNISITYNKQR
jgi:hypothetical protein